MNYQIVRAFGYGSHVSIFGSSPKAENAAVSSFRATEKGKTVDAFPVLDQFPIFGFHKGQGYIRHYQ